MNSPGILPEIDSPSIKTGRWMVVIYNDDVTPQQLVVFTLMHATGCSLEEASMETWEAETYGHAAVHFAAKDECQAVAVDIRRIGVKVEVGPEWND